MEIKPILVTLTAPSAAGKSYLFNYIRDVAKLPCIISTTTRQPRAGEVDGVDYFFITEEESKRLEANDELAELAIYNGVRYGVTKKEFHSKLNESGISFLIVEPSGIEHYVKPAIDAGASNFKVYVHVDPVIRLSRFRKRASSDLSKAIASGNVNNIVKAHETNLNRLEQILGNEKNWFTMATWDKVVIGTDTPEYNLAIILKEISKLRSQGF